MATRKKYVVPEIDREGAGPGVAEFIAFAEELTRDANAIYEEVQAADLKSYKVQPDEELKEPLRKCFDAIFTQKTSYTSLNRLLARLH